jgi:hypothetical protein
VVSIVLGVALLKGKRVPAWLLPLGVIIASSGSVFLRLWTQLDWPDEPVLMQRGLITLGLSKSIGGVLILPSVLVTSGFCASVGYRARPHRRPAAAGACFFVLVLSALVLLSAYQSAFAFFGWIRVGMYLFVGLLTAVALLGSTERGRLAGAVALVSFAFLLVANEQSTGGLVEALAMVKIDSQPHPNRYVLLAMVFGDFSIVPPDVQAPELLNPMFGLKTTSRYLAGLAVLPMAFAVHTLWSNGRREALLLGAWSVALPLAFAGANMGVSFFLEAAVGLP